MQVCLRSTNVRMAHQRLDGLEVVPVIQKSRGDSMPHDVRTDPLLNHGPFYHGSDQAVNRFVYQTSLRVRPMLLQGLEEGMIWICPGSLVIILDGDGDIPTVPR